MKLGLSTYSLLNALKAGQMTVLDAIDWIADNGGEHMEMVPYGYTLIDNLELADAVRERARERGIDLSNYCLPANFVQETPEAFDAEVARLKGHVDLCARLGVRHMRHDVTAFTIPQEQMSIDWFDDHFEEMVEGSRQIADYAAPLGITTTIENHGFSAQSSDRVQRILRAVNRSNFRTTLDVGNFLCVDEDPIVGVMNNLKYVPLYTSKISIFDLMIKILEAATGSAARTGTTCAARLSVTATCRFAS